MKKHLISAFVVLMVIFMAFTVTSCGNGNSGGTGSQDPVSSVDSKTSESRSEEVDVRAVRGEVAIALADLDNFNFGSLFEIYIDGSKIYIEKEYIDASEVKKELGTYTVRCAYGGKTASVIVKVTHERNVTVTAETSRVTIKDTEIYTYDYKSLFEIRVNDILFEIKDEFIDVSAVKPEPDTYVVTCSYDGKSAKAWVTVTETPFIVGAYEDEVYVNKTYADKLDLTSLFGITLNGEIVEVTDDMIFGEVGSEVGDYEITLKIGSRKATAIVRVIDEHVIRIGAAYSEIDLTPEEIASYDFLSVFYIYEDGKFVKVTADMIDTAELSGAVIGDELKVTLNYASKDGKGSATKSVKVNITEVGSISIKVKTAEVFDDEAIDVKQLFEITDNEKTVEVTDDMISGKVDFEDGSDECEITLKYKGHVKTATIKKVSGVAVKYPHGEVVSVKVGTDINAYDFSADFKVYINGIGFDYIDSWIDRSTVDFTVAGVYTATLTVKYNDVNVGRGAPKFAATAIKTITYRVVPGVYDLSLNAETVEVGYGVSSYNVTDNINLIINGFKQNFTDDPAKINSLTTYYKVISAPDIMVFGAQKVIVDVYVYGADFSPVRVKYDFVVKRGIEIIAENRAVFTGDTVYTPDLFRIFENGKPVNVTLEMIGGIVNTEEEGIYELSVTYKGVVRYASISVVSKEYLGVYATADTTIAKGTVEGEDGDVAEDAKPAMAIGDLIIDDKMTVNVHGIVAADVKITGYGLALALNGNNHEVHIFDGIAVFVPLNEIRLKYHEEKRPLVYFNKNVWSILDFVTVDSSKNGGVYSESASGKPYSIFLYKVKNVNGEIKWFAMKVKVEYNGNGDTKYSVVFGYTYIPASFKTDEIGAKATVSLDGSSYSFVVTLKGAGLIDAAATNVPFEGMSFNGTIDGSPAALTLGSEEAPMLRVGGTTVFSFNRNDFSAKKYSSSAADGTFAVYGLKRTVLKKKNDTTSIEYTNDLLLGDSETSDEKVTTELFSYKFLLDTANKTFTVFEKDDYYGLYGAGNGKFIFLDGFGKGVISTDGTRTGVYGFDYSVNGKEITLAYMDKTGKLSVSEATLMFDGFGNVLTVKSAGSEFDNGTVFENTVITHGAIVTIDRTVFRKGESKDEITKNVKIVTADGEYSFDKKNSKLDYNDTVWIVDRQKVSMSHDGFYYVAVNLEFDNGTRMETKLFAIQVIGDNFAGSPFANDYGLSLTGITAFAMDDFGVVTYSYDGTIYTGFAHESDGKLYATVKADGKQNISLTGEIDEDGILTLTAKAKSILLTEYYCAGAVVYVGNGEFILRSFATDNGNVFYVSSAKSVLGNKTTVKTFDGENVGVLSEGLIIKVTFEDKEYILRIVKLGDDKNGFETSDMLDGEYKYADENGVEHVLTLDGFGSAVLDGSEWKYTISGNATNGKKLVLTNNLGTELKKVIVGVGDRIGEFRDFGAVTANDVSGKSYSLEIDFISSSDSEWGGDDSGYVTSRITISFGEGGKVGLGFSCTESIYNVPSYIGNGTYAVSFTSVIIEVNGYRITLEIDDPWKTESLKIKKIERPAGYDEEYGAIRIGQEFKIA